MNEDERYQSSEINEDSKEVGNGGEINLGSEAISDFDPFGDTSFADEALPVDNPKEVKIPVEKPDKKTYTGHKEQSAANPLEKAMVAAETKEAEEMQQSLFTKLPVFDYAGASESVEDTSKTFEDLRIEKATDFPELDDGKRVSWTVEYGKITKVVSNPKGMTIAKMKSDLETSKEFLDSLKKSKDKEPVCKLKPKVTAQTKGKIPAYKGVFTSMEAAVDSGKVITLFPAKDGKVYEMRQNEMGRFITPTSGNEMLNEVQAGFIPALPPITFEELSSIISFFRSVASDGDFEALVNIYWDKEAGEYLIDVPKQTVTPVSVESIVSAVYDNDRYIHYMDIHSHNKMKAFFSSTDNKDEKATRVYVVIGNIFDYFPEIKARISNGGEFLEIAPGVVFEGLENHLCYPHSWNNQIEVKDSDKTNISTKSKKIFKALENWVSDLVNGGDNL